MDDLSILVKSASHKCSEK